MGGGRCRGRAAYLTGAARVTHRDIIIFFTHQIRELVKRYNARRGARANNDATYAFVLRRLFTLITSRRPRGSTAARAGTKTACLAELANFRPKNTTRRVAFAALKRETTKKDARARPRGRKKKCNYIKNCETREECKVIAAGTFEN